MNNEKQFFLQKGNRFFDGEGFGAPSLHFSTAVVFATEDAALDKAEELGLHLDSIKVVATKKRSAE